MKSEAKESQGRPILEWYEQLPEPIRSQAIENYDPDFSKLVDEMASSSVNAIWWGFDWEETEEKGQGLDYWFEVCNRAKAGEFDDPIEKLKRLITRLEERQEQFEKLIG